MYDLLKDKEKVISLIKSLKWVFLVVPLFILGMFVDIFLLKNDANLLVLVLIFLLIFLMRFFFWGYDFFMKAGLYFLAVFPFFVWINAWAIAEKMAVWCYIFFFIAGVKLLVKVRKEQKC